MIDDVYSSVFSSKTRIALNWTATKEEADTLLAMSQPLTATQLARKTNKPRDRCSFLLRSFTSLGLTRCINQSMLRSRLFWPTKLGRVCQTTLVIRYQRSPIEYDLPMIDWNLYSQVTYSHRAAVIKHLSYPMQPTHIRRIAVSKDPGLKLSANNVRDVVRFLCTNSLVNVVGKSQSGHRLYDLAKEGKQMQRLLIRAEQRETPIE